MKKRQILAWALAMSTMMTCVMPAYAEELIETQQYESVEETDLLLESFDEIFETEEKEEISYKIDNVLVESEEFADGCKLTVKVVLNTTEGIAKAVLSGYAKEKGATVQYEWTSVNENECIFELTYNDSEADDYILDELMLYAESEEFSYDLTEYENLSYTVYGLNKGEMAAGISFFNAEKPMYTGAFGNDGKFVIVLDPGHDPECTDRGKVNGVWEPDLNWRMAEALKKELDKYAGVEVYMNRTWAECPGIADTGDDNECLKRRVLRGVEMNADLVISLHNNALGNGQIQDDANGAFVFVTRYMKYQPESEALAEAVLAELENVGLKNNGVLTRYYGDDATDTYPDGTGWDYYAITRYSTMNNIPSLLIEHAFMDNLTDLELLRDGEIVDEMGRADARAIVEYYGLELKSEVETEEETEPEIEPVNYEFRKDDEGNVYCYVNDVLYKGKLEYEANCYYFDEETGVMATGWSEHHNNIYYYDAEGRMQYGKQKIDGNYYFFDQKTGVMFKGERVELGHWVYYSEEDGRLAIGWTEHHGKQYYYDENGWMVYGKQEIDGNYYFFDQRTGVMFKGERVESGHWVYYSEEDGALAVGWTKHNGKQYYYNENGWMVYGKQEIDGNYYFFDQRTGVMFKGERIESGHWVYYSEEDGALAVGWTKHHGKQYYYNENGWMVYGKQEIDGNYYFFDQRTGVMFKGEKVESGHWVYYSEEDGRLAIGWTEHHGKQYYYDENGWMVYGKQQIDGETYFFNKKTGVLQSGNGWSQDGSAWVYRVDGEDIYRFTTLKEVFNWASTAIKYEKMDGAPEDVSHIEWYSDYGFEKKTGNCFVMAATFCYVARLMGYEAYLVEGSVPLAAGGVGPHGWVEIVQNGTVYVCDPNFTNSTKRNGYFITYGTSGTWRYMNFERVE